MLSHEFRILNNKLKTYKWVGGWQDGDEVFLWRRDAGKRVIEKVTGVPRYFCIASQDYSKTSLWNSWKAGGLFERGVRTKQYAYLYVPANLYNSTLDNWFTDLDDLGIKPLEGDINRLARLMIDMDLRVVSPNDENPPRYAFYDIETDDRKVKIELGAERILSVAIKDGQTGEETFYILEADTDEAERAFLIKVIRHLIQYDTIVGYNNYDFDDKYIAGRLEKHNIDNTLWRRIAKLDIFNTFERQHIFTKYNAKDKKLDTISKAIVKRGKIDHKEKIYDLWANNKSLLETYNLEDIRLLFDMEKELNAIRLVMESCSVAGSLHSYGFSPYRAIDTLLLRLAARNRDAGKFDYRYNTAFYRPEHKINQTNKSALAADKRKSRAQILKDQFDIDYEEVTGALVLDVTPGMYQNVYVADFNSLYPNTMRAFNIGPDTLVTEDFTGPKCKAPNGLYYRTDIVSSMAQSVEVLLNARTEAKAELKGTSDPIRRVALDVRQNALKELANSMYGVTALWGGRWHNPKMAESITSGGRCFLPYAFELFNSKGYRVVAGDTDSFFLEVPAGVDVEKEVAEYLSKLKEYLTTEFNCYRPDVLKMSIEKGASALLIVAKKLYAMKLFMKDGAPSDETIIKGLKLIKGNTSKWGAKLAKTLLDNLLSLEYDSGHYERFLARERQRLQAGDIDYRELLISARLGKDPEEYATELVHVRIAKRLNQMGIFTPAYSTVNYLITGIITEGTSKKLDGIDEREIVWGVSEFDCHYYWNQDFMPQALAYLPIVFPEVDWEKYKFPNNTKRNPFVAKALIKRVV